MSNEICSPSKILIIGILILKVAQWELLAQWLSYHGCSWFIIMHNSSFYIILQPQPIPYGHRFFTDISLHKILISASVSMHYELTQHINFTMLTKRRRWTSSFNKEFWWWWWWWWWLTQKYDKFNDDAWKNVEDLKECFDSRD